MIWNQSNANDFFVKQKPQKSILFYHCRVVNAKEQGVVPHYHIRRHANIANPKLPNKLQRHSFIRQFTFTTSPSSSS